MKKESIKVLTVEDDINSAKHIKRLLEPSDTCDFNVTNTECLKDALEEMQQHDFGIVLLDLNLPDSTGYETFEKLISKTNIPIIVLTGTADEQTAYRAMREGAQDFIFKDDVMSGKFLENSIRYAVERHRQNRERRKKLQVKELSFRTLIMKNADGIVVLDDDFKIEYLNTAAEKMFGRSLSELEGEYFGYPTVTGENTEIDILQKNGGVLTVEMKISSIYWEDNPGYMASLRDVTERKESEKREKLARDILELLNSPMDSGNTIRGILSLIKESTGMEAVGIRLKEGDDYPYYETNGFPGDFVEAERYLCMRDEGGEIVRDNVGNPVLECMCGNVIRGRTNPDLTFFTEGGSFWSNCTSTLLASTTEEDRQARTRNRCNGEGFESVALIPLRTSNEIIGLLQLNDHRTGRFTKEMIHFFEGLGASIGIALWKRRTEKALCEERERLFEVLETLPAMICLITPDYHIPFANRSFREKFGDDNGRHCYEYCFGMSEPCEFCESLTPLKTGRPHHWEVTTPEGDIIDVHDFPLTDTDGSPLILEMDVDITERRHAEEELMLSKTRMECMWEVAKKTHADARELSETIADGLQRITKSKYSFYGMVNDDDSKMTIYAWSRNTMKGCDIKNKPYEYIISSSGLWGEAVRGRRTVVVNDYSKDVPGKRGTPEGHVSISRFMTVPIIRSDRVIAVAGVANKDSDYTKEDELQLESYMVSVQLILDRRKLSEEKDALQNQFLQSQKMEAIGQLAGGIAHDFNNMLTVIMGNANLAMMQLEENAPFCTEFKEIIKASERAKDLTMQLLTFARKEKINVRLVSVSGIIEEVTAMLKRSVIKKINIRTVIEEDITISADANQLEQALMNVCMNACDAMPGGGDLLVEICGIELEDEYCRSHLDVKPGRYCFIQISDTGIGMPEGIIDKVFDPFFTTKGTGKGTGLGLSTTLGIIKSHNGDISIYSNPGEGTTVKIYLPIAQENISENIVISPKIATGTETILVVDDEKNVLNIAKKTLESAGYKVVVVESGKKAISLFRKRHMDFSLVLLDMIMPEMDGRDVFPVLKKIDPGIKIVLSSGYSINGKASDLIKEGVNGFVQKPFSISELCNTVRRVLDE
ncbi:MAG TPA: response regulator [bacterium]|nr:response regulator [bacterium]